MITTTYDGSGNQTSSTNSANAASTSAAPAASSSAKAPYELGPLVVDEPIYKNSITDLMIGNEQGNGTQFTYKAAVALSVNSYTAWGPFADQNDSSQPVSFGLIFAKVGSNGGLTTLQAVDPTTVPVYNPKVGTRYNFSTPIALAQDDVLRIRIQGLTTNNCNANLVFHIQVTPS